MQPVLRFSPLLFVPGMAIIGAANNQREWLGAIVGGGIGLFFALIIMGRLPAKVADILFPGNERVTR